jgi:DNA-binding transcriptional MerR regulator
MSQWYVKEFSKITKISVRTLHHYDHIDLLKPSIRLPNDYRLYSEADLLKLQLILALKFFGLNLTQIKALMKKNINMLDHLRAQKKILQERLKNLHDVQEMLDTVIDKLESKSINFDDIVQLMEDYRSREEQYYGSETEQQKIYEQYLDESSGEAIEDLIADSHQRMTEWKKEDWAKVKRDGETLDTALTQAIYNNLKPTDPQVQDLIRKHFQVINCFCTPTKELYYTLSQLYVEHPDFRKLYDSYHPNLARFLADAMKAFAEREL